MQMLYIMDSGLGFSKSCPTFDVQKQPRNSLQTTHMGLVKPAFHQSNWATRRTTTQDETLFVGFIRLDDFVIDG
jgi:hypothetical protein